MNFNNAASFDRSPSINCYIYMLLIYKLKSEWPVGFALQPKNRQERLNVIYVQQIKKDAAAEIERLMRLIEEHNSQIVCDKERCGYAGYKRDCPDCPKQWIIDV